MQTIKHPLRGRATGGNRGLADREEVRRALALLVDPTASVELRGLPSARSRVCSGADLDGLVDAAEELSEDRGVYYTLNPVDPVQLPTGSDRAARVADIARRRWLLIDVDPEREPNTNATAAEKLEAKLIADGVGEWLTSQGWPEPVQIDSGNGYHLLYRIDLACTPESQVLLRQCLTVLAQIHDTPGACIDRSVHNASRISKLPGTWARKGTHSPDRPHRATKLLSAPAAPQVVSVAQLQALAAIKVPSPDAETVVETQAPKPSTSNPLRGKATSGMDVEARAVAYLAECPPAISGQGGHGQTMSVARALVWGFGLGVERGLRLLQQHYNPGCQPPWSEKELRHKCEDAETTPDPSGRPRGYLNEEWRPSEGKEAGKPQVSAAAEQDWEPIEVVSRATATPFPLEVFPEPLRKYAQEVAYTLSVPVDFVAVPMLGVASGAIGNSRRLQIKAGYTEPALLWTCVVGGPGTGKSPAIEKAAAPIYAILREENARFDRQMKRHKEDRESVPRPDPPRRVVVQDATREALTAILAANPRGLTMVHDELRSLFEGMDQYKGGRGNDRQFYLSLWSTATIISDRKNNPDGAPVTVYRPFLAIAGGMQPDTIPSLQAEASRKGHPPPDDGGMDRFLFSFPGMTKVIPETFRELSEETAELWVIVLRELLSREMLRREDDLYPEYLRLTDSGKSAWITFTVRHADEVNDPCFPAPLRGPWSKLQGYCARLALVLHCLDQACGESVSPGVDHHAIERAAQLVAYFKDHYRLVVRAIRQDHAWRRAKVIAEWLARSGRTTFKRFEAFRALPEAEFPRPSYLDEPIERLIESNLIRVQAAPGRPRLSTGRPPAEVYEVNPGLPAWLRVYQEQKKAKPSASEEVEV